MTMRSNTSRLCCQQTHLLLLQHGPLLLCQLSSQLALNAAPPCCQRSSPLSLDLVSHAQLHGAALALQQACLCE
jgi:hypothetical protein